MNSASEAIALVALLKGAKRPWNAYAELVEEAGGALPILEDEQGLLAAQMLEAAELDVARWTEHGIRLLTVIDRNYPANLRAVHDRPPLIFAAGELKPRDIRSVAVIGTRNPSADGLSRARAIAEQLADGSYTVASGLAAGIDTEAHRAALSCGGRTVAVIGTGLRRSYPPENAPLQLRIATECAVISQFWPEAGPTRKSFPQRNAVMSGLTLATVIVEAGPRSGARTQARLALGHGRPVLLSDTLLAQPWGRELAARPGTHVVRSPGEVIATVERLASCQPLVA